MPHTFRARVALVPLLALLIGACSEGTTEPDPDPGADPALLAGVYVAEDTYGTLTFITMASGETIDWLEEGASLTIELAADGKTTGRLFVPGADEDGEDFDADLKGTWKLQGDTVHFSHSADSFIRDTPFVVKGSRLEADHILGDTRVRVVLERR